MGWMILGGGMGGGSDAEGKERIRVDVFVGFRAYHG